MNFYLSRNLFMPLVNRILDSFVYKIGVINPVWISSFRIYGSLIFLFHFLSILPDFYTFWGQNAIVNPDIMKKRLNEYRSQVLTHSLAYLLAYSLTRSLTYLLTYLLTHSLTHSLTHLLIHSLTHSLTHSYSYPRSISQARHLKPQ